MPPRRMPMRIQKHLNRDKPPKSMIVVDEEVSPYDKLTMEKKGRFAWPGRTPIYGVYFICCIGAYKEIVSEQLATARRSGLLEKTSTLFCFICQHDPAVDEVLAPYADKIKVIATTENLYERFALTGFRSHIPPEAARYYLYYFHSKGVSREPGSAFHERRRNLDYFILEKHEACLFWLNHGYDAVGASLCLYPALHFSGNFWWATSRHLGRLPREIRETYLAPEMHVCSVPDGRYVSVSQETNNKKLCELSPLTTEQVLRQSTCKPARNVACRRLAY